MTKNTQLSIFLIYFFSIVGSFAQEVTNVKWIAKDTTTGKINLIAYWNKDESKIFYSSCSKNVYDYDSLVSNKEIFKGNVKFSIEDSTKDGYLMKYKMVKNLKGQTNEEIENINSILLSTKSEISDSDLEMSYNTNELGTITSYNNLDSVYKNFEILIEATKSQSQLKFKSNTTDSKKIKYFDNILKIALNPELLFENFVLVNISNLHNLIGLSMGVNDTLNYTETKNGLAADCYLFISSVDTSSLEVEYVVEKYYDDAEVTEFVNKRLKDNINSKDLKKEVSDFNYSVFIKSTYFFDLNTGWPTFIKIVKETLGKSKDGKKENTSQEIWVLDADYKNYEKKE